MPMRSRFLRRMRREAEREEVILVVFAIAAIVFMIVTIGYGFSLYLLSPPTDITLQR